MDTFQIIPTAKHVQKPPLQGLTQLTTLLSATLNSRAVLHQVLPTQGIKPRNHALFWPDQLSCTGGAGLEENLNIPAGLSHGYIHACPMGKQLSHFLARGHFLLPYGQFPRPARKSTCPGTTARDFFRALLSAAFAGSALRISYCA